MLVAAIEQQRIGCEGAAVLFILSECSVNHMKSKNFIIRYAVAGSLLDLLWRWLVRFQAGTLNKVTGVSSWFSQVLTRECRNGILQFILNVQIGYIYIHTHTRVYTQLGKAVDECMFKKGGAYLFQISDSVSSNFHFACGENKTEMICQVKLHFQCSSLRK